MGGQVGAFYHLGEFVDYDRDLARDYYVACLRAPEPTAQCAVDLGMVYEDADHDSVDLPLAVALWDYGIRIGPENTVAVRLAHEKLDRYSPQLTEAEKAQTATYSAALQNGDFSALPHIRDARPVPELAAGTPQ